MKYRLLNNAKGVISSRRAKTVNADEVFIFEEAPEVATAIFESNGNVYYRRLSEGKCTLPLAALNGVIKIVVTVMDGKVNSPRVVCEELRAEKLRDGSVLLVPNDGDLSGEIARLFIENHELRIKNIDLLKKLNELDATVKASSEDLATVKQALKELVLLMKNNTQI